MCFRSYKTLYMSNKLSRFIDISELKQLQGLIFILFYIEIRSLLITLCFTVQPAQHTLRLQHRTHT